MFYVLKTDIGWNYLKGYPVKGYAVRKKFKLNINDLFIDCSHFS